MLRIKICGVTQKVDLELAIELGASEVGLIFAPSLRRLELREAKTLLQEVNKRSKIVGVFQNERLSIIQKHVEELQLDVVQLHGSESSYSINILKNIYPSLSIFKTIPINEVGFILNPDLYLDCEGIIFDCAQSHLRPQLRKKIFEYIDPISAYSNRRIKKDAFIYLAGGINNENFTQIKNYKYVSGVDLSSGIEVSPGIKDQALMRSLFRKLKENNDA
ncbi:MAG: phosphoribosylanthranilate isomerase [Bacteriovoracaceae bacterium]|nr:phosphoribosylanthranilate isomerase [Bacteriovoracaceae bacterium]